MTTESPVSEQRRLQALHRYQILDTPPEIAYDNLVELAAHICNTPISAITLIDAERQWFKAKLGISVRETARALAFCDYAIASTTPLIVEDTLTDPRFAEHPWVVDGPHIRFYAGIPLVTPAGLVIGCLTVMDTEPRQFSPESIDSLQKLAHQVVAQLELRLLGAQQQEAVMAQKQMSHQIDRFFALSIALMAITDLEGHLKRVNHTFEKTVGRPGQELLATRFIELIHPTDRERVESHFEKFATVDSPLHFECLCLVSDGSTCVVSWSVWPATTQGEVYFIGRDLTEANALQKAKRRTEERYRTLVEHSHDLIWSVDATGKITFINQAAQHIYGRTPEEMIGHSFLDFVPPEQAELDRAAMVRGTTMGDAHFNYISRVYRRDGSVVVLRANSVIERDESGQIVGASGISRDMTVELQAQESLRHSEERFRRLFSSAAAGIVTYEMDGRLIQINPTFAATVGYAADELLGSNFFKLIHPDDLTKSMELTDKLTKGEIDSYLLEQRHLTKEGNIAWVRASVSCVFTSDERPQYIIAVTDDITQQKNVEARLQERESLLRIAGRIARVGGWSIEFSAHLVESPLMNRVLWSDEVCAIHEVPSGFTPTTEEAIQFYAPEWREKIQVAVDLCITQGTPFDLELEIITAKGQRRWIEATGEAQRDANGIIMRIQGAIQEISDKKQAEIALRASEERFRQMAEIIDDVFWIHDRQANRIVYVSPRYEAVFGTSREELYRDALSYQRNIHPDDILPLQEALQHSFAELDIDYRLILPGAEIRWVNVRTYPMYNTERNALYSVGIARDITPQKRITEQLRASEEQYRLLFTHNPNPMWVYDYSTYKFLAVNKAAIDHYGYSEAEFLAMGLEDIRRDKDNQAQEAQWHARNQHLQRRTEALWRHRKKDGSLIDVETISDVIDFNGRKARIALANDVTVRLQANERLREQAELLDKAQDAIMVRDLDHRITYWNRSAERLYGWSAAEVMGQKVYELLHKDQNAYTQAYQHVMNKGEWVGELVKFDRQGRELLIEGRWTLVHDDENKPRAILVINTDITDRKKLEAQFLRAQRMESIGTLAGGIAHDLNNVLAPILLSMALLKKQARTPSETKLINLIENSAKHGADMVRQVLAFARGVEGERTIVQVSGIISELAMLIRDTFDRKIRVQVNVEETLPTIIADPTQIHQVLLNLAVNARDAMPDGGKLTISASAVTLDPQYVAMNPTVEPGSYIMLSVADTGTGIPVAIRERIFDPFFTTKEVGKGTGLGLATVQAVVKGHGGFINVYSETNRGTDFKIYLPALGGDVQATATTSSAPAKQGDNQLILVVDDDPTVRLVTQQTLEAFGYRVITADDGAEAVAVYVQHQSEIAIVLTDMMMPIMDGFATIHALTKINPNVKIIAASGLAANGTTTKVLNLGVKHFLAKPYTADAMLKVFAEILSEDAPAS